MADQEYTSGTNSADDDLGAPVAQLLDHTVPVAPEFRARVGRSIERRVLAADATLFGLLAPLETLVELLRAIFEGLGLIDADDPSSAPSSEGDTV